MGGEVGSLREVVAQQAVRVLVRRPLPRRVRLAEVDARPEVGGELDVAGRLAALIACQRAPQACRQRADRLDTPRAGRPRRCGCPAGGRISPSGP